MDKTAKTLDILDTYKRLADEKADSGDLLGALGLYYTVYDKTPFSPDAISDIADCYADMGLLELSNKFWFKYLTVCPKGKQTIAYEELAINFFYLDNLWTSGYYFHLKVERDGFIAEEGLDEEIIKFFSATMASREQYYIAYPFDKADYSYIAKRAKRAFAAGDIPQALREYSKIPAECRSEEVSGDFATALFLNKSDDEMLEVCKDSLKRHGENVNAYCNLSSLYHSRGDEDKAKYYYDLALKSRKGDKAEDYKIATVAIERGDHITATKCISVILGERPYDDVMNFFYSISLVNLGKIEEGLSSLEKSIKLSPNDVFYRYYYELIKGILAGDINRDEYLPLKYAKELPKITETAYKRQITKIINGKAEAKFTDKTRDMLRIMLYSEDLKTAKSAAFLLGTSQNAKDKKIVLLSIMDGEIHDEVKNSLIYLLIVGGEKERINAVLGNYFVTVKPKKVIFEDKADGALYKSAYALTIVKALTYGIDDSAKIAFKVNTLYKDYAELIRFNGFGAEVIAAICYLMCEFVRPVKVKDVCAAFGIDKALYKSVEEFYEFVKKTEPIKNKERAEKSAICDNADKE